MARSMVISLAIQLSFSYLTSLATCSYVPSIDLLPRDDANCPTSYTPCGNPQLPSNFCCPTSTTCISLDNSSSAICCPSGSDCSFIEPITCDIQAQNATADPEATLKTTRLTDSLPTCGGSCCPFGYTCQDGTCALIKDTSSEASSSIQPSTSPTAAASTLSIVPSSAATTSSIVPSAAATLSIAPSSEATALSIVPSSATASPNIAPNSTQLTQKCPAFPATAVVAGFFPGLLSGALAAAIVTMCLRRKQRRTSKQAHLRSSGGAIIGISDPIPSDTQSTFRTDFLLRKGSSRYPDSIRPKSMLRRTGTRVRSIFGSSPSPKLNGSASDPSPPAPPVPVTPPRQIRPQRQPSTESIKVYSPAGMLANTTLLRPGVPNIQPDRPNTTFSEVMEKIGFQNQNGEPYFRVTETPAPSRSPLRNG
ncbi:hypothetical protein VTN77DRAFT_4541 [Rasamsonia byssochlamydoides]|uniref:uncharacterized protein n=1 Tax=Rasamsonia byssochlamydoides TaxID=89139 RepID=UPI003743EDB2